MQRLFSMFPRGAPGVALVVLRFVVAASLWTSGPPDCLPPAGTTVALFLLAILLCLGMLTPAVAVLCAALHCAGLACSGSEPLLPSIVAVATASALALLGPGAYSIDCRLFGRHVFVVSGGSESP